MFSALFTKPYLLTSTSALTKLLKYSFSAPGFKIRMEGQWIPSAETMKIQVHEKIGCGGWCAREHIPF
jgi:hypothetical protein